MDKNTANQLIEIVKRYNKELEELYRNYNREVKAILTYILLHTVHCVFSIVLTNRLMTAHWIL